MRLLRSLVRSVLRRDRGHEEIALKTRAAAVAILQENPAYQTAREEILREIVEKWLGSSPMPQTGSTGLASTRTLSPVDRRNARRSSFWKNF